MKRRTLLMCAALVMSLAMAISGTLAYLTDTETTTNVMTVGNVDIELIEQQYDEEGNLEIFKEGQLLYPAVPDADNHGVAPDHVGEVDKIVTVANVGSSDAFVRTVIAFPELNGKDIDQTDASPLQVLYNSAMAEYLTIVKDAKIGDKEFTLWVFTYPEAIAAGQTTEESLLGFYLKPTATNDDLKGFNGTYTVRVLAQAMQTVNMGDRTAEEALDLGLGEITAESNPWSNGAYDVIEVTPETAANVLSDNNLVDGATYLLKAGEYKSLINDARGKSLIVYAEDGVTFTGDVQLLSSQPGGVVRVENIHADGSLTISGPFEEIQVYNNKVDSMVLGSSVSTKFVVDGNSINGLGYNDNDGNRKYNLFISNYGNGSELVVTNNTFMNSCSHAIQCQGPTDGSFAGISVKDNTFIHWGTNGKADRGAFKIYNDATYAPDNAAVTAAMQSVADDIIKNNSFVRRSGNECIVNVYGIMINKASDGAEGVNKADAELTEKLNNPDIPTVTVHGDSLTDTVRVPDDKTLIVEDATIDTVANYGVAVIAGKNANVILKGGEYTTFEEAQVLSANSENAQLTIHNGTYTGGHVVSVENNANVVINGGTFNTLYTIAFTTADELTAEVTINGGMFNTSAVVACSPKITIHDGTFNLETIVDPLSMGDVTIHGGMFNISNAIESGVFVGKNTIIIHGGTFNVDPTDWLAEGCTAAQNAEGKWVVTKN